MSSPDNIKYLKKKKKPSKKLTKCTGAGTIELGGVRLASLWRMKTLSFLYLSFSIAMTRYCWLGI